LRILLSEIVLPNLPQFADETRVRAEEIAQVKSIAQFAALAEQYSLSDSRENSGRLNWRALSDFPPAIAQRFLSLERGGVTEPISSGEAVVLFQLRDIEETSMPSPAPAAIDYATYYIAGGRTEVGIKRAAEIHASVDTCDDLYGVAQDQPARVLDRGALTPADIPEDIALELAKLDENEVSTTLTRAGGNTLVFLMLCGRTPQFGEDIDRGAIRTSLLNERVGQMAEGFLAELRVDAIITD
jgi:peptidyl-prolyl cis-trans isomerase SurA